MQEAWLKCEIEKGLYPGEHSVSFRCSQGQIISLCCGDTFIDKQSSVILVTVLRRREKVSTVRLHDQSLTGTTLVDVPSDSLSEVMQLA
jgi:hypothetical protein